MLLTLYQVYAHLAYLQLEMYVRMCSLFSQHLQVILYVLGYTELE